jgi:hypothetical protein
MDSPQHWYFGKRAVLFLLGARGSDGRWHPSLVIEGDPQPHLTDYDYGAEEPEARERCDAYNAQHGISREEAITIVNSSLKMHLRLYDAGVRSN